MLLLMLLLGYCIFMLAFTIVSESMWVVVYGVFVLFLTNMLCKATNRTDEETEEK